MTKIITFRWSPEKGAWSGLCPRCGVGGYYIPAANNQFSGKNTDLLHCLGGHAFVAEYPNGNRNIPDKIYPIEWFGDVPDWLPESFHGAFQEMLFDRGNKKFRSAIALCGILLEAQVNEAIPVIGERSKTLFSKLQYLKKEGKIDADQFSDATITRLTRNSTLHPEQELNQKEILEDIPEKDAEEAIESVIAYFERAYKYRPSRALPAGNIDKSLPNEGEAILDSQPRS